MIAKETELCTRIKWIDIAKGIGILAMVLGHSFHGSLTPIIYSFHMPLFFILTGFTIKFPNGNFLSSEIKDLKRLIIPCVVIRAIILLGNCLINHQEFTAEIKIFVLSLLWGNHYGTLFGIELPSIGRVWFLPALFLSKLIYIIILVRFDEKTRFPLLVALSLFSMFLGSHNVILPQNLDMIFVCVLFLEIGHRFREIDFSKLKWYLLLVLFSIWTCCCHYDIYISMNMRQYSGYGLCIIVAVSACVLVFLFSQSIEHLRFSRVLIFFGRNTLIVLAVQTIAPYFYEASSTKLKIAEIIVEISIVVVYVFLKKMLFKLIHRSVA